MISTCAEKAWTWRSQLQGVDWCKAWDAGYRRGVCRAKRGKSQGFKPLNQGEAEGGKQERNDANSNSRAQESKHRELSRKILKASQSHSLVAYREFCLEDIFGYLDGEFTFFGERREMRLCLGCVSKCFPCFGDKVGTNHSMKRMKND